MQSTAVVLSRELEHKREDLLYPSVNVKRCLNKLSEKYFNKVPEK